MIVKERIILSIKILYKNKKIILFKKKKKKTCVKHLFIEFCSKDRKLIWECFLILFFKFLLMLYGMESF